MIPNTSLNTNKTLKIVQEPTKTYRLDTSNNRLIGYTDALEAMKQAIYKIIFTERYQYLIYSWNYGIELEDLFGKPKPYVYSELKRRIREALLQDDRITEVDNFDFSSKKGDVKVTFTVHTVFGDIESERTVNIGV
ncbi:MAG TPA: DUF2634 domain-containing protein [Defluviitoga tunisiensis]|nr:DUF2634 domain-containing protein [Defluviitoga tunisiensis]